MIELEAFRSPPAAAVSFPPRRFPFPQRPDEQPSPGASSVETLLSPSLGVPRHPRLSVFNGEPEEENHVDPILVSNGDPTIFHAASA